MNWAVDPPECSARKLSLPEKFSAQLSPSA